MTTLSLDQLIDKDIMVVNSTARNKQEVLEELGRLLEAKGYLKMLIPSLRMFTLEKVKELQVLEGELQFLMASRKE